jgi:hypothetical protein
MRRSSLALAAIAALSTAISTPAFAGGPWISIETPVNPMNSAMRGAYCIVRVYHHGNAAYYPVTATAEGLVNGQRRTIQLKLTETGAPGVYAVNYTPEKEGTWILVMSAGEKKEYHNVTVVVGVGKNGQIASASVPMKQDGNSSYPLNVQANDIERMLKEQLAANTGGGQRGVPLALGGLALIPFALRRRQPRA